ncbi:MAG: HAMP domain-containing histidine kinase [bacterium]|nr:HAMP domain-containing histidine kinase [bacterium]
MNSMTPIASLAGSISGVVRSRLDPNGAGNKVNAGADQDIYDALGTIERRSQGLMHFVESYRDLTRIPIPDIRIVAVAELLSRVDRLMEKPLAEIGASRRTSIVPDSLTLACDPDLIEQVLINLYSNAVWALRGTEQPCLEVSARINWEGRVVMEVKDNGPGILPAVIDKIFIPFFTTRKGGSGIGLAVSRQIMRLHNGNIAVTSIPGESTVFSLSF